MSLNTEKYPFVYDIFREVPVHLRRIFLSTYIIKTPVQIFSHSQISVSNLNRKKMIAVYAMMAYRGRSEIAPLQH
jgi:hypothetical protein